MGQAVTIQFLNHASVKIRTDAVTIVSDPWLWGSIFNNGWDLLWASEHLFPVAADSDFIWISHEHPDHFSPAFFRRIADKKPRVLFQSTRDSRVARYLGDAGFDVVEVENGRYVHVTPSERFLIGRNGLYDSWSVFESGGKRILNLNDCIIKSERELRAIRKRIGHIDALLTQFSYAGWVGNSQSKSLHEQAAQRRLDVVRTQLECLEPDFVIPFASFAWYSHEENAYLNASVNRLPHFLEVCALTPSVPIVLQPLDAWDVGDRHDNTAAIHFWECAYARVSSASLRSTRHTSDVDTLRTECDAYRRRIFTNNSRLWMTLLSKIPLFDLFGPLHIHLTDIGTTVRFSFFDRLREVSDPVSADIEMSCDSLSFIFANDFGFDTLMANGRCNASNAGLDRVIRNFAIGNVNAMGWSLGPALFSEMLSGFRFGVLPLVLRELKNVNPE
jgi:L-ascorbate metabolism protein UlaG (beta-lactamase superfamily)